MHTIVESMSTLSESAITALQLTFSADPMLWTIVGRSLAVSGTACLLACGAGVVLGAWLGVARFAGRGAVLALLNTMLAVPSVVVGLVVYLLLSRSGPLMRSLLLAWDERYALLTVLIASFGRAISEVGAVMIVGGNIDGFTRVMTTAIALETSKGDLPLALALGLVLLAVVLALNVLIAALRRWREGVDGTSQGALPGVLA